MRELPIPNPRCTGLFIPIEILNMTELNSSDRELLAWIDALDSEEYGGCFASNDYFSMRLGIQVNTISIKINKLISLGLVRQVSFDGRIRILKACKENWFQEKITESQSACDLNHSLHVKKIKGSISPKSKALNIYSKDKNKEDIHPNPQSGNSGEDVSLSPRQKGTNPRAKQTNPRATGTNPRAAQSQKVQHLEFVMLTPEEYGKLLEMHTLKVLDWMLDTLNSYIGSSGKKYLSHYHVLQKNNWVYKRYLEESGIIKPRNSAFPSVDRRTLDKDGKPVEIKEKF